MNSIDSNTLHICAEVLLKRAGDAEKEKHLALAAQLKQGVSFLSHLAGQTDTVTVPRELLRRVLNVAMADSKIAERHAGPDFTQWTKDRANIEALRKAAGMDGAPEAAALDALAAESQESGGYDEVVRWREYVASTDALRRFLNGDRLAVVDALRWRKTPQGHEFWGRVHNNRATPGEMARALDFARGTLIAMGYASAADEKP